jgi:hypothetical protein
MISGCLVLTVKDSSGDSAKMENKVAKVEIGGIVVDKDKARHWKLSVKCLIDSGKLVGDPLPPGWTWAEVKHLQKATSKHSQKYQGKEPPNVGTQEGGEGRRDARLENRIQYAACGVWGVSGVDSGVEVHQNLVISRASIAS